MPSRVCNDRLVQGEPIDPGSVRASDDEREQVAAQLRQHLAAGRLTVEEFRERLDEAFTARTRADLCRALRELPADPLHVAQPVALPLPSIQTSNQWRHAAGLAAPSIIATGAWVLSGHHGGFWPGWVMLANGSMALRHFTRGRHRTAEPRRGRW